MALGGPHSGPQPHAEEQFLDLLQRAESYGHCSGPKRPAPLLCVVAPPSVTPQPLDGDLRVAVARMCGPLQALLEGRGEPTRCGLVEELHAENLAQAWHASTASKPKVPRHVGLPRLYYQIHTQ